MSGERQLYLSTFAPVLDGGRALRTYTCVRALAMLGPVDLAYVAYGGEGPSPEYQAIDGIEFHEIKSSRGLRRGAVYVAKRLQGTPHVCCHGTSPEVIAIAERLALAPGRGRVIVGDVDSATALMPLARRRPVIYNAHNVESEYIRRRARSERLMRASMRRYERRLLTRAAESWMVSRADIISAKELAPTARLRYAPNVVDVSAIKPRDRVLGDRGVERSGSRLLMVGDFKYRPNWSGLDFLVSAVLPLVWDAEPDVRLTLVGRGLEEWTPPDPRLEATGFVADLEPFYAAADCVVVPLTEGAGTPLKFVEALAYRMPVVATPLAAKGLDVIPDVHYREGADARGFAEAILGVLSAGAEDLARQARQLAECEYSIESLAERLAA